MLKRWNKVAVNPEYEAARKKFGFKKGQEISVSTRRLLRHLFSRCETPQILSQVVRCTTKGKRFEMGLRFKEAPPDFIGDILHWSSAE